MSEETLIKEFTKRGKIVDGELLLDIQTAMDFIAACQRDDIAVIGIEGFLLEPGGLRPQLDMIADYSSRKKSPWSRFRDLCNRSAAEFLRAISPKPGLVFSLSVKGEGETRLQP
jgi:hypothetical protein